MVRSSKISFKWANSSKKDTVLRFISAYSKVVQDFVDILWSRDKCPALPGRDITSLVYPDGLSARAVQAAAKQASAIVRGAKAKHSRRLYVLRKLKEEGDTAGVKRLEATIRKNPVGKPELKSVCPELDARFCKIDLSPDNSFEMWVTLGSLGRSFGKIELPFQRNRHFNKMLSRGTIKGGVRLSSSGVTFMFELPDPEPAAGGTVGIDIGHTAIISTSSGAQSLPNKHGHNLETISRVLCRKKKGSKAFRRAQTHRDNYINWSINRLDLKGVAIVVRENIKDLRRGRRSSRALSHWTYPAIVDKLESRCAELGVLVRTVEPAYTSQRCHECGFTRKSNRRGSVFKCRECGHTADADINAARNIAICLPPSGVDRRSKINRTGFYWFASGQEHVVPAVKEA